jgi:hypothetical protein
MDRLRMFGNRVLRRVFGAKRAVVTGGWRNILTGDSYCDLREY